MEVPQITQVIGIHNHDFIMKHIETHDDLEIQNILRTPPFFVTSRLHDVTGNDPDMAGNMLYYMEHMGIKERLRRDILWYQSSTSQHIMIFHFFAG